MAIVRFKGYGEIEVPVGTSILEAAQKLDAPEGYACGGVCACSTCHVYVAKGEPGSASTRVSLPFESSVLAASFQYDGTDLYSMAGS